jgi:hypothetical protein
MHTGAAREPVAPAHPAFLVVGQKDIARLGDVALRGFAKPIIQTVGGLVEV